MAGTQLKTPNPAVTGEAGVAYVASLIGALVTLFKLDLSDVQQGASVVLIVAALSLGTLAHGAIVRKGRAQATHVISSTDDAPSAKAPGA